MKLSLYLDGLRPTSSSDQLDPIGPALSPGRKTGLPRSCVLLDLAVVLTAPDLAWPVAGVLYV